MTQFTLKKLSEVLGISISTVSRALKDHPDISEATKAKVKELASALNFEPNNFAVQLRTRQSNILGILVPTINNYFYDSFIAAVEEEAVIHGYTIMILQSKDMVDAENANINLFRRSMIMGLFAAITIQTEDLTPFDKLEELNAPVIFVDRVPPQNGYYKVCLADEDAAKMAAEKIIKSNKKNVLGLFGHPHLSISKIRSQTFKNVITQQAPEIKLTIEHPENIEGSKKLALKILQQKNRPDVIFCMGDLILIGVMYAIHQLKLSVPNDISVISISNGLFPTIYNPKITFVETSGFKLGKLAFNQMLKRLKKLPADKEVTLESVMIEGGSIS
jgi:LacI family transcriptional regulator